MLHVNEGINKPQGTVISRWPELNYETTARITASEKTYFLWAGNSTLYRSGPSG